MIKIFQGSTATTYDGQCYIDDALTTFYVAPHFDSASLTPDMCKDACAYLGAEFTLAGITQGNVCLCGKDGSGKKINFTNFLHQSPSKQTFYIKIHTIKLVTKSKSRMFLCTYILKSSTEN